MSEGKKTTAFELVSFPQRLANSLVKNIKGFENRSFLKERTKELLKKRFVILKLKLKQYLIEPKAV